MTWTFPLFDPLHPPQWNALLLFGSLLLMGLVGGHAVVKNRWVPRITGYLLAGMILGGGLHWLAGDVLKLARIFSDMAIALMVYQLGRYVDLRWLRHEKWLLATLTSGALLCGALVWLSLAWAGVSRPLAALAAVFSIGTAPAVVMAVLRDVGAEGIVSRRLAALTALNNLVALLAAYVVLPLAATDADIPLKTLLGSALYSLCGSILLAFLTYRLMILLARLLGRDRSRQFVLVIAVITLTIGAAHALRLPVLLPMLVFAILSKNLDLRYDLMELEFGVASELFVVVLFVTAGASIQWIDLRAIGIAVLLLIAARGIAMAASVFLFARPARLRWRQAGLLALGLLPMSEAGIGLAQVSTLYPHTAAELTPLLAGTLVLLELLGPFATQFALIRSGEGGHDSTTTEETR